MDMCYIHLQKILPLRAIQQLDQYKMLAMILSNENIYLITKETDKYMLLYIHVRYMRL